MNATSSNQQESPNGGGGHQTPSAEPRAVTEERESKSLTLDVSPKAIEAIRRQLVKRGTPEASLRVGLRGGGCSGFTYVIEFHDGPPRARDQVLDFKTEAGAGRRRGVGPQSL